MNKYQIAALLAVSASTLGMSACTSSNNDVSDLPPGKYEKTVKSTDAYGTTTEQKNTTEVDVDDYGNKKAVVETETTRDPEGLLNKSTTRKSKKVIQERY